MFSEKELNELTVKKYETVILGPTITWARDANPDGKLQAGAYAHRRSCWCANNPAISNLKEDEVEDCIRNHGYDDDYYLFGNNCRRVARRVLNMCCLREVSDGNIVQSEKLFESVKKEYIGK